jgi:hypothetical protein
MLNEAATVEYKITFIVSVLLGKVCVAAARSSIRVLTVESYPVSIRTMGFGVSRISSTFGGMAAPQIAFIGSSKACMFELMWTLSEHIQYLMKSSSYSNYMY